MIFIVSDEGEAGETACGFLEVDDAEPVLSRLQPFEGCAPDLQSWARRPDTGATNLFLTQGVAEAEPSADLARRRTPRDEIKKISPIDDAEHEGEVA